MFQRGDELRKNLRILLNSWNFIYEDRRRKPQMQTTNAIDYINIQTTQQLQLHSRATRIENVDASTTSNVGSNEPSQTSQSPSLPILDQQQQFHDNSLIQIHGPEKIDFVTETPSSPAAYTGIERTPDVTSKLSNFSDAEHTVLKDANNREASTAATKGEKRRIPSSPKQRKLSSRLSAKRSRQSVSSFPVSFV